ncbi:MAG TPA: hypothetical protein PLY34_01925 [Ferruginibacter sp.]|nr:hypothetical protein [Ferruginibacter sp.]HPH89176.1 hypothetical protein [Ferruginibacter sp.]
MKFIKYFFSITFLLVLAAGCKKEKNDDVSFLQTDTAPKALSALFTITQDNTGLVTITPNGESISYYEIFYGDATTDPVSVLPGKNIQHVYPEGVFNVKIVGHSITGKVTEATQQLTVAFRAPEDLDFTAVIDAANNFKVNVSATAQYETFFKVYFGEDPNEVPASFLEGETVSHTYAATGTFTVKVIAYSGGTAVTELTKTVTIVDPVLLPLTFESPTINYSFVNFGGGDVTAIANPQQNGINTSAKVGRMVKNAPEVWGGSFISLSEPINFSANKIFRMKVFSPRVGAKVLLKVENATDGNIAYEKEATCTVANAWEDLAFDYTAINTANSYHKVVLIFDLGTAGDGSANFTFLFDDIRLTNTLPSAFLTLPVTFDDPAITYSTTDFGNTQTVNDVDPTNSSNKVKKTTKPNGAETWAGTTLSPGFQTALPFSATATQMSVRVYSPAAGIRIRFKVEDRADNTRSVETEAVSTVANAWETLVFDFANQAPGTAALNLSYTFNLASIFFEFGTAGNGKVFYWDDVKFLPANVAGVALPLDFQSTTLTYTFTGFGRANAAVIDNPDASGINTSTKVGALTKDAGSETWAGSFIEMAAPIDFSSLTKIKMKVWSPAAGITVKFKMENLADANINTERDAVTTVANAWEELTYDFSGIVNSNNYQRVVVFFDFGNAGTGANYYFDDIKLSN